MGLTTDTTALPRGIRHISIWLDKLNSWSLPFDNMQKKSQRISHRRVDTLNLAKCCETFDVNALKTSYLVLLSFLS